MIDITQDTLLIHIIDTVEQDGNVFRGVCLSVCQTLYLVKGLTYHQYEFYCTLSLWQVCYVTIDCKFVQHC